MRLAKKQSEKATRSGYWPMYRFNPDLRKQGLEPFLWDYETIDTPFKEFLEEEIRYKTLQWTDPHEADRLFELAEKDNEQRLHDLKHLAGN
jgi:pyruvate-ferredoxin/flavodoxin oxidoreductase